MYEAHAVNVLRGNQKVGVLMSMNSASRPEEMKDIYKEVFGPRGARKPRTLGGRFGKRKRRMATEWVVLQMFCVLLIV